MARAARNVRHYVPRIEGVARTALHATAELLGEVGLGPVHERSDGWEFEPQIPGVRSVRLGFEQRKKFLGGVYRAMVEVVFDTTAVGSEGGRPLRLHYAGRLLKGAPELRPETPKASGKTSRESAQADPLATALNADAELTRLLGYQDIEHLTVTPESGSEPESCRLRLRLIPIGGSFVWLLMPPVKYAVRLPRSHARALVDTVTRLAELVRPGAADHEAGEQPEPHETQFAAGTPSSRPQELTGEEHV